MKKAEIIEKINQIDQQKLTYAAHAIIRSNPINTFVQNRAYANERTFGGRTIHMKIAFGAKATKENLMNVYHAILDEIVVLFGIDEIRSIDAEYTPEWYPTEEEAAQEATGETQPEGILDRVAAELEARKDRSAWDKGVTVYALELLEELRERAAFEGRNPEPGKECREWMLNGARDWNQYSWGGSSLIYDADIAERLCSPSELKKTRHGERRPNRQEEWLDTQARALAQACSRVARLYRSIVTA